MLRLMDANLDRLSEGLRVLEDIARFVLTDSHATEMLKRMRHELAGAEGELRERLLAARDAERDVGREGRVQGLERRDLVDLVTANARRAEESLRVLEEFAKLPETPREIAVRDFEGARFTLYQIERDLVLKLSRQDKRERIHGLHVIIDTDALAGRDVVDAAQQVIEGGGRVLQLRDKRLSSRDGVVLAKTLAELCRSAGVLFIVNDSVEIALAADADGVHLGQDDLPIRAARQLMPPDRVIGGSARTLEQARAAEEAGADYIGAGAVYASLSKPSAEVIGVRRLGEICKAVSIPVVAIGGITSRTAQEVLDAGADGFAVIDAVLNSDDIEKAARELAKIEWGRGKS